MCASVVALCRGGKAGHVPAQRSQPHGCHCRPTATSLEFAGDRGACPRRAQAERVP
jgi:hypothetical protein